MCATKEFFVSIGVEGIIANYQAVVIAKDEKDAEAKVREMWDEGDYDNAEIGDEDYGNADLMDNDGVYIREEK